jgi:hypothetical protein
MDILFPPMIITYLTGFAPVFSANHFQYFRGLVLAGMLLGQRRKCVTNIARVCFFVDRHLSSGERFLSAYHWDLTQVSQRLVALLQEQLGDKLLIWGGYLTWVDTTLVLKVKGRMPGVQKWHDHSGNPDRGSPLVGHHWALAGLLGATYLAGKWTPLCWPVLANLIPGNTNPFGFVVTPAGVAQAMTFWDAVCPLIAPLSQTLGDRSVRVVADAYFCKAPFITWMLSVSVQVITRRRKEAVGWDDPPPESPPPPGKKKRGKKPTPPLTGTVWKINSLLPSFPSLSVPVFLYGKIHLLQIVTRDRWIRGVLTQKVRVVVIKTTGAPSILLSPDLRLCPEEIMQIYALRCALELGIREAKQHFGLGQYQCIGFLAMTRLVRLTWVSFCLWRLTALTRWTAPWLQDHEKTSLLSFTRLSRAVRRFVIHQILQNSASQADFQKSEDTPEEIIRLVA